MIPSVMRPTACLMHRAALPAGIRVAARRTTVARASKDATPPSKKQKDAVEAMNEVLGEDEVVGETAAKTPTEPTPDTTKASAPEAALVADTETGEVVVPAPPVAESSGESVSDPPLNMPAVSLDYDEDDEMSASEIKAALLDSIFGTERGLSARSEVRAEISELISQLEAANPTPSPSEAIKEMGGVWKLVYTSNSELLALLAASKLPLVDVGDITQVVDTLNMNVENKVELGVPFSRTTFSTNAKIEVRSPKRLQLRFDRGVVETPQLLQEVPLPTSTSIMGQTVDLSPLADALRPIQEQLKPAVSQLANLIDQQPDLSFPISNNAETWLLTTFLDSDTRISRGDGGSVYVLVKDASF